MIQKIRKDKKGVSPVIGVILMVAATIVIAAVVIAMLGGFTAPGRTYAVLATAEIRGGDVFVTYMGGPDADQVNSLSGTAIDNTGAANDLVEAGNQTMWTVSPPSPGAVAEETSGAYTVQAGDDNVIVTANFLDGSSQVILNTWV